MKTINILVTIITAIIIAGCNSSKKASTSTTAITPSLTIPSTTTNTIAVPNFSVERSSNGVYFPGNEELMAIQSRYKDVTLVKLQEGYSIYTEGTCINCHGAKNIYNRGEEQWKDIIEDMAKRSNISDDQKDAVYKYVLAIKAVQSK